LRGRHAGFVFQQPLTALTPHLTIGQHLREAWREAGAGRPGRADLAAALERVGLDRASERLGVYPHQVSGGQRQRALIAMAIAHRPKLLIADEPTTALDASTRNVVLELLRRLARDRSLAVWLITHDLHAVRDASDEVTVMYAGAVVEQGATSSVLSAPRHPYTAALLAANPAAHSAGAPLPTIPGAVPLASEVVSGCRFHPRCPRAQAKCIAESPALTDGVACFFPVQK
ncbi:MAG: oligopeptide/dipeptide ABC transporter ATP-binding protein, partial [Archangium sp.]